MCRISNTGLNSSFSYLPNFKQHVSLDKLFEKTLNESCSYEDFKTSFIAYFGEDVFHDVSSCLDSQPHKVEAPLIVEYLLIAAARIKISNLQTLYHSICFSKVPLDCVINLSENEIRDIASAPTFDHLNERQLSLLAKAFRCIPGTNQSVDRLISDDTKQHSLLSSSALSALIALKAFNRVHDFVRKESDSHLKPNKKQLKQELANTEYLAREIAYAFPELPKNKNNAICGTIFPSLTPEGNLFHYVINDYIDKNGLVGYFCSPLVTKDAWKQLFPNQSYPLLILWRGTYCKKAVRRDFKEGLEAGKKSYDKRKKEILKKIKTLLCAGNENNALTVIGHSLGGADAQRTVMLIAEKKAKASGKSSNSTKNNDFSNISDVRTYTWNSPRMYKKSCRAYNQHRELLAKKNDKTTFFHTHNLVKEDIVQKFGHTLLGWNDRYSLTDKTEEHNPKKDTRLFKYYRNDLFSFFQASLKTHTGFCLDANHKKVICKPIKGDSFHRNIGPRNLKMFWRQAYKNYRKHSFQLLSTIKSSVKVGAKKFMRLCSRIAKLFAHAWLYIRYGASTKKIKQKRILFVNHLKNIFDKNHAKEKPQAMLAATESA